MHLQQKTNNLSLDSYGAKCYWGRRSAGGRIVRKRWVYVHSTSCNDLCDVNCTTCRFIDVWFSPLPWGQMRNQWGNQHKRLHVNHMYCVRNCAGNWIKVAVAIQKNEINVWIISNLQQWFIELNENTLAVAMAAWEKAEIKGQPVYLGTKEACPRKYILNTCQSFPLFI